MIGSVKKVDDTHDTIRRDYNINSIRKKRKKEYGSQSRTLGALSLRNIEEGVDSTQTKLAIVLK